MKRLALCCLVILASFMVTAAATNVVTVSPPQAEQVVSASYIPAGKPNQRQCVATASMPKRTRNSRVAVEITEALPP